MSVTTVLYVALGGAIGAVGRFAVVSMVGHWAHGAGSNFPYGTMVVNILGSFILGALIELSALAWSPSPEIRAMLVVGMLGAFTTFSTFSLDVVTMATRGAWGHVALYMGLSVALSVLALYMGMQTLKALLH
ncbi:putative fluoride ion transporter CrcB [Candidatus Terasakiella magnetica]|uniref:Fluoride-specific ion channel FluC n=1 Tax=Candidatus Terasakiella magnetica TaxID=1867952 RepID=A0A1C3RD98_9PROT|nr:fluoride efflux transporter CrcB [Candidatus Terasakiella magnetica]SCA55270.1 putative fluoride ion transporter CrcB [Candidatus Terasakiella magnetica]